VRAKPKNEEQRAQEKSDAFAKTAISVAIENIDRVIERSPTSTRSRFKKACTLVHLGGRVFKDSRPIGFASRA
jgi:hypothetical protein